MLERIDPPAGKEHPLGSAIYADNLDAVFELAQLFYKSKAGKKKAREMSHQERLDLIKSKGFKFVEVPDSDRPVRGQA